MKKTVTALCIAAIGMGSLSASSTNLENIYGKNDLDLNGNYVHIYGNNFGAIIESNITEPYCMDVDVAGREIDLLKERNSSLNEENGQYSSAVKTLESDVSNVFGLIARIESLMNTVISSGTDLYTLSTTLTDPEMKNELQKSIEENRQQKFDLENRLQDLNRKLSSLKEQIGVKKRYITVNNLNIRRNDDRIEFLKACIDLSTKDSGALNRAITRSSSLQEEVDSLLSMNF
ncbi:hypothetical protein [Spirochaeta isovalerica]|uniref:Chromosome segregation ATPase n=1 Tax=Spirochaeta isovalerica TaxID=150 RepID=A0A841R5N0_9SPIO|nr:hypothetical protein [Spirochaeta isovalerica]MBB6480494.1 chromosome segregation ATPase [Spirochaeta isovalerica]